MFTYFKPYFCSSAASAKAADRVDAVARKTRGTEEEVWRVGASSFIVVHGSTTLNFAEAKAACAKKGGVLASLTNYADNEAVKKLIAPTETAWLGASKDGENWKW